MLKEFWNEEKSEIYIIPLTTHSILKTKESAEYGVFIKLMDF